MTMDKALATAERGEHELTTKERTKVVESLVIRGDWSGLGAAERVRAYNALCAGYGLNPLSRPFEFLKLQGKDVLYARREATDQLAAMHRVNREIVDGPKLIDLAGTKLIYCVVRATLPNGRVENSTATLPLTDPANVLMKCETKGKRRATLAILGMGMLSEDEVDSIPGAVRVQHEALPESAGNPPPDDVAESLADVVNLAELRAWYVALDLRSDDTDASEHASGLAADRLSTLGYRLSSVEHNAALGGTLPDELRYVHDALSGVRDVPACLALCHTLRVDASDAAKRAMARYFGALCSPPITDPKKAGRALAAALNPPPPPTGTDGPARDGSDPAAAIGATVAANAQHAAAQASASAEPRVVLDDEHRRPTPHKPEPWQLDDAAMRAHVASKGSRTEIERAAACHGEHQGPAFLTLLAAQLVAIDRAYQRRVHGTDAAMSLTQALMVVERCALNGRWAREAKAAYPDA